jgi:hypothetical protein
MLLDNKLMVLEQLLPGRSRVGIIERYHQLAVTPESQAQQKNQQEREVYLEQCRQTLEAHTFTHCDVLSFCDL